MKRLGVSLAILFLLLMGGCFPGPIIIQDGEVYFRYGGTGSSSGPPKPPDLEERAYMACRHIYPFDPNDIWDKPEKRQAAEACREKYIRERKE